MQADVAGRRFAVETKFAVVLATQGQGEDARSDDAPAGVECSFLQQRRSISVSQSELLKWPAVSHAKIFRNW